MVPIPLGSWISGAAGAALAYLMETQRSAARQIQGLATYLADACLQLGTGANAVLR